MRIPFRVVITILLVQASLLSWGQLSNVALSERGYKIIEKKQRESTFGVADKNGREVVPPKYEFIDLQTIPGYILAGNIKPELTSVLNNFSQNLRYYSGGTPGIQIGNTQYMTSTYRYNLRFGLLDENGNKVLGFDFDEIEPFEQYLKVKDKSGNWGVYDIEGNLRIPTRHWAIFVAGRFFMSMEKAGKGFRYTIYDQEFNRFLKDEYDFISVVSPSLLVLRRDGITSLSRTSGTDILKGEYDEIYYLDSGYLAVQKEGKWGIMDTLKKQHTPFQFDDVLVRPGKRWFGNREGKWGRINSKGEFVSALNFCTCYESPNDIVPVYYKGKRGYVDKNNAWVIEGDFSYTGGFEGDFAWASSKGKSGVINKAGKWIVPPKNYEAGHISEGIISVQANYFPLAKTLYDYSGKEITKVGAAYNITRFSNGLAGYSDKTAKWGFLDKAGKTVIKPKWGLIGQFDDQGRNMVSEEPSAELNRSWGLIDMKGTYIVSGLRSIIRVNQAYITYAHSGEKKSMDKDGNVLATFPFEVVEPFANDLLLVKQNEKVGLVKLTGEVILEPVYTDIRLADAGKEWVWIKKDLFGLMNLKDRKEVLPFTFEDVSTFDNQNITFVKIGKWGALNSELKQMIPFKYDEVLHQNWLFGTKAVSLNGSWGLIDIQDRVVLPFMYEEIGTNIINPSFYLVKSFGITSCLDHQLLEYINVY